MSFVTKRLRWALALSLGLNLFLLAFFGARWLHRPHAQELLHEHGAQHGAQRSGRRGHGLGPLFGPPSPELRGQHKALGDARRKVADALQAEPYDAEQLKRALAELRITTQHGQDMLHERLLEKAGQLSSEERRKLAQGRFLRELPPSSP